MSKFYEYVCKLHLIAETFFGDSVFLHVNTALWKISSIDYVLNRKNCTKSLVLSGSTRCMYINLKLIKYTFNWNVLCYDTFNISKKPRNDKRCLWIFRLVDHWWIFIHSAATGWLNRSSLVWWRQIYDTWPPLYMRSPKFVSSKVMPMKRNLWWLVNVPVGAVAIAPLQRVQ